MARIVIFLDGTWNTHENNTNVWRLKSLCDPDASGQMSYYSKGVGTSLGEKIRGGVSGFGIEAEITDAYSWLCENFEDGDEIFIFGFSRGAYTARSLSGLIAKCGVLRPGAPLSIEQLFERYRRREERTIASLFRQGNPASLEERWIIKYCAPTNIKMLGVWDTVGALGSPFVPLRKKIQKYHFLDTHLRVQNDFAFHALAIDEHRKSFEPTLWTRTTRNDGHGGEHAPRPLLQVEQRWFVGAHANVGGGYPSDILAQLPLQWLMEKAAGLGLQFRDTFALDDPNMKASIADSYHDFAYGLGRYLTRPFYRPIGPAPLRGITSTTERINETIDGSVFERWKANPDYRPQNLVDWAARNSIDPAGLRGACLANDPSISVS